MKLNSIIIIASITIISSVWSYCNLTVPNETLDLTGVDLKKAPPCIQLHEHIKVYSKQYGVPLAIALGVAKAESGYTGPFHWAYNPKLTSSASAYGAMQIQVPTASYIWGKKVTSKQLLTDLDLNVHISMKLLALLHKKYGDWGLALGAYNTGRPVVNGYAIKIYNHKIDWI
jgi:soluble lytic murein transglycosylase-like protein